MKKIFLSLVAFIYTTMCFSQSLVATLSHGDDIKMFYGTLSFRQAMAEAVDGDVINLSGGRFEPTDITKNVSIRGTGIDESLPTEIINWLTINIPSESTGQLALEGIFFSGDIHVKGTLKKAYFLKNRFNILSIEGDTEDFTIANCIISSFGNKEHAKTLCLNCYFNSSITSYGKLDLINCVINSDRNDIAGSLNNTNLCNCIIRNIGNYYYFSPLPSTAEAINCIYIGRNNPFENLVPGNNNQVGVPISIFIDEDPSKDLTDEAKKQYLGVDGTPVGMYGGFMPFSTIPSYPRITKMNIASKTTADGKLSVDIEVSAAK